MKNLVILGFLLSGCAASVIVDEAAPITSRPGHPVPNSPSSSTGVDPWIDFGGGGSTPSVTASTSSGGGSGGEGGSGGSSSSSGMEPDAGVDAGCDGPHHKMCNGVCTDVSYDVYNCGYCGNGCTTPPNSSGYWCDWGQCHCCGG